MAARLEPQWEEILGFDFIRNLKGNGRFFGRKRAASIWGNVLPHARSAYSLTIPLGFSSLTCFSVGYIWLIIRVDG
jgi:hypothetical protein